MTKAILLILSLHTVVQHPMPDMKTSVAEANSINHLRGHLQAECIKALPPVQVDLDSEGMKP